MYLASLERELSLSRLPTITGTCKYATKYKEDRQVVGTRGAA